MGYLAAFGVWVLGFWLIRKDTARRDGISSALWIPTLWVFILLSRSVSSWIGGGGGIDTMEGSPVDRLFYFGIIILALVALSKRRLNWSSVIAKNWPIFLFYSFFLISVLWAESPSVSFKRWFKDLGNVFVALVVVTERNPLQAIRAVVARCAYILIPLSVVYIRFFPSLGRRYSRAGGLEVTGVTTQKNALGILVVICAMVLLWDWYERSLQKEKIRSAVEKYLPLVMVAMGIYLLHQCNSQTSIACLILGAAIITTMRVPLLRRHVGALGGYSLAAFAGYLLLDEFFGLKEAILGGMGRDSTLTGRTDVWAAILALKTDPIFGTGFYSFWSDRYYQSRLPQGVGHSAHNGYLETYIDGGVVGLLFLGILMLSIALRVNRRLGTSGNFAVVQFAVLIVILIGSISESHFARMGSLWFLFLFTALEWPQRIRRAHPVVRTTEFPVAVAPSQPVAEPIRGGR